FVSSLFFCGFTMAEGFGLKLDKNYYFQKKDDKQIEITVANESNKLLFADILMYEGLLDKKTDSIIFDFNNKVLNYDIFPQQIAIPAGQKRTVKLIRAGNSKHIVNGEEYFRIRAIPKSPDEAVKANPDLLKLLSPTDLRDIEDSDKVKGSLRVFVGSGSVLVIQNDLNVRAENIKAVVKKNANGIAFKIINNSPKTVRFNKMKAYAKGKYISLGEFALRSGKAKEIEISIEELKLNGLNEGQFEFVTFASQSGGEIKIPL
ncbi:hypothetical protein CVQ71_19970, partial [Salmonella enterica]|nr:hypothetical protein [Salmonella enterica]EDA0729689.1 hypothetical protein [Salmonella enterica]